MCLTADSYLGIHTPLVLAAVLPSSLLSSNSVKNHVLTYTKKTLANKHKFQISSSNLNLLADDFQRENPTSQGKENKTDSRSK